MSFWTIAAQFALNAGKDYFDKKGIDGTLEDIEKLSCAIKKRFSSGNDESNYHFSPDDYDEDYDEDIYEDVAEDGEIFSNKFQEFIEKEEYQEALDFVETWYQNDHENPYYNYYLAHAQLLVSKISYENDTEIYYLKEATKNFRQAFTRFEYGSDTYKYIKEEWNFARDLLSERHAYHDLENNIDNLLENQDYSGAVAILNKFYTNKNRDFGYWFKRFSIELEQMGVEPDAAQWDFSGIDKILYQIKNDKEISAKDFTFFNDWAIEEKTLSKATQLRKNKNFKQAVKEWENFYSGKDDKEEDFEYWFRLFGNYLEGLKEDYLICDSYKSNKDKMDLFLSKMNQYALSDDQREIYEEYKDQYNQLLTNISSSIIYKSSVNLSDDISPKEQEYISEYIECFNDGIITDREKRLLDKLRKSLNISEERAKELEYQYNTENLIFEEKEYADEIKEILKDGVITDKERRLLNKLAKSLNISPERSIEIEKIIAAKKK